MKAFIDVNLFMDVLEERENWRNSYALINGVREGKVRGYISALTTAIIYFLRIRVFPDGQARKDVREVIRGFRIVDLTSGIVSSALRDERFKDFEDALQFHSARKETRTLVTRNKPDFKGVEDEIEVLTPEEFLKKHPQLVA